MDAAELMPLLEQLDDDIDDIEEVIKPLVENSLSDISKKLPVLDQAKLHVLVTYTLESLIFCESSTVHLYYTSNCPPLTYPSKPIYGSAASMLNAIQFSRNSQE